MLADLVAVVSILAFAFLWAWAGYQLLVLAVGWPRSKAILRSPFDPHSLRNPVDLPSVSIVLAAKDEARVIRSTLEQIIALRYPRDLVQVIVAEDGSTDATRRICDEFASGHSHVLVLHEDGSAGKAAALNRASRRATGEILLFLDADTRFDPDLLLRAVKFLHDHPDVDVAQAIIDTYAEQPNLVAKLDQYETIAWYRGILSGKDRLGLFVPLCGTGMFIRRRVLERAGPWNERSLAEDIDMAVRLSADGASIRVLPTRVWRQPPYSVRDFVNQRRRWWGGALQALRPGLRQMRNPRMTRRVRVDMLLQLLSPVLFVGGVGYLILGVLFTPLQASNPAVLTATVAGVLTSQALLIALIVGHAAAHRSARNLNLIPGVYLYWALQFYAVLTVTLALLLRRPPRWRVTRKRSISSVERREGDGPVISSPAERLPSWTDAATGDGVPSPTLAPDPRSPI